MAFLNAMLLSVIYSIKLIALPFMTKLYLTMPQLVHLAMDTFCSLEVQYIPHRGHK